jgi:hypothetical protein
MAIGTLNLFATPTCTVTLEYDDVTLKTTRLLVHNTGDDDVACWFKLVGQARQDIAIPAHTDVNTAFSIAYTRTAVAGKPGLPGWTFANVEGFGF